MGKNYKRFGSDSIYLNTLVGHLKSSKVDPSNFRSWRAAVEEGRNVSETVADLTNHLYSSSQSSLGKRTAEGAPRGSPRKPQAPSGGYQNTIALSDSDDESDDDDDEEEED